VCKICGEPISTTARKCTHCDSYQDWRGGINISNTVLSLLVALVSVLAVAIPAIHEALKAKNSELRFAFQGANTEAITIFATNSGTRPGTVQSTLTLKVSAAGKTVEVPLTIQLRESSAATIIEPSQSRLLDLNPPADSGPTERVLSHYFKDPISIDLDKASCTIPIESNDFRTKRSTAEIPVQCKELSGFIREINDRVVSTNQKHSMR